MILIGYGVTYGASLVPVTRSTVMNLDHARKVAGMILKQPGATLTFEVIHDGRAEKLEMKKEYDNEAGRTKSAFRTGPTARRIHAGQSAALAG